ncbi:MAG: hypothetical protein K6D90_11415 [Lachnospiraceae bacterium]|nr:hypothetical protein [Lachnospiraceae bacterium]
MNRFLDKMERKIGRFAIRNLSLYLIIGYVIGYILRLTGSLDFMSLDPYQILHGQVWRIVTWILMPPSSLSIFTIVMLFFYYSIGTSLERTWGTFRYNVYLFSGMLFTLIGAFILYGVYAMLPSFPVFHIATVDHEGLGRTIGMAVSTYYINLSIFLAFAASYPDMRVLLYFIIPVKIKWMAWLDIAVLLISFFMGNMAIKVVIVASLLNFLVFFLSTRNFSRIKPSEVHRRAEYRRQTQQAAKMKAVTKHKCAICGRTEEDGDNLEFRFCSKCNGNYEYCQEHLFTHKHIL